MMTILIFHVTYIGGAVTRSVVFIRTSGTTYLSEPNFVVLEARSAGGLPINYAWTRNNEIVSESHQFRIRPPSVNGTNPQRYAFVDYYSTLIIVGRLPGVYGYTVSNRANRRPATGTVTLQGT